MTLATEDLLEAFNRATTVFNLCPNRVWAVGKENLPALLPPSGSRLPRHENHEQCTVDFCEYSQRDFTRVTQRHECDDEQHCLRLETRFSAETLAQVAIAGSSTVWALDGETLLQPPRPYMAISHVWSDGTGAGSWPAGHVNRCLYVFFCKIAEHFQCEGIWWDTLCIPLEKAARTQAIRKIQSNYQDARITLVHDCFLRNWEWTNAEDACFAILMSLWFSRAWTALELSKSQQVKVVFKGPRHGRPLIKDLDEEILAGDDDGPQYSGRHKQATQIIKAFRNGITSLDDLLIALGPRYTSWPKDRAIVSGLLAGVDMAPIPPRTDIWQQDIYLAILKKIAKVSHGHLFHNMATISTVSWCPPSLFYMPVTSGTPSLRVTESIDLIGTWTVIPVAAFPDSSHFAWGNVHPLVKKSIELCLRREPGKCLLLAEPASSVVERAILVKAVLEKDSSAVLEKDSSAILGYQYIGACYFSPAMSKETINRATVQLKDTEVVLLGNLEDRADDKHPSQFDTWAYHTAIRGAGKGDTGKGVAQDEAKPPEAEGPTTWDGDWNAVMADDNKAKRFLVAVQPLTRDPVSQRTSLHYAVWRGYNEVVQQIATEANMDTLDSLGQNPLHIACGRGNVEIIRRLLGVARDTDKKMQTLAARSYNGQTPLHYAAHAGSRASVRVLIEEGADLNAEDNDGITPLHIAAEKGLDQLCSDLLRTGKASLNAMSKSGFTPLHLAIMEEHSEIVECLISHGADVRAQDRRFGWTPLHCAAEAGWLPVVKLLLQHGADADVDVADFNIGWTPLHLAASMGRGEVVELLISGRADGSLKDNQGWTPRMFAEMQEYHAIVGFLAGRGEDDAANNPVSWTPLHVTALDTRRGLVKLLVQEWGKKEEDNEEDSEEDSEEYGENYGEKYEEDSDEGTEDNIGEDETPLHWAARNGQDHAATLLLRLGHDIEARAKNKRNMRPLHFAAQGGHPDLVRLFLERGCDSRAVDSLDQSAIHFAAKGGDEPTVRVLLDAGAGPEGGDLPPLHLAAIGGHRGVAQTLISKGADVNRVDSQLTALQWAVVGGHEDMVKLLVMRGADVNFLLPDGGTVLHIAVENGHEGIVAILLDHGAIGSVREKSTPLHLAAEKGLVNIARMLISHEDYIDSVADNATPLATAAQYGQLEVAKILLASGAEVNLKSWWDGWTPLHFAASEGHKDLVQLLIENGADIGPRDKKRRLPSDLAEEKGYEEVVKLLIQKDTT